MPYPRPQLRVFAGPNGAGKSTLVARYSRQRLPIVNPDVIALGIETTETGAPAVIEAGKIALRKRSAYFSARESFAIETTLSGNSEIRLIRDASATNYKVNFVFVGVDIAEVSVSRVAHRVRLGQHFVPTEDILRRYPRSMENLPVATKLADRSLIVDNTGKRFRLMLIREGGSTRVVPEKLPEWVRKAIPEELL
jgi:predicted ABC-type ATPase